MKKLDSKWISAVNAKVTEVARKSKEIFGYTLPDIEIKYNIRGTTSGKMDVRNNIMYLHPVFLQENGQTYIDQTVVHELAHQIDYALNPEGHMYGRGKRSIHGPTWKNIMRRLGADPSRCHTYDISNIATKKNRISTSFVWTAKEDPSVTMELGAKRHANMLNGVRRYWPRGYSQYTFEYVNNARVINIPKKVKVKERKSTPRSGITKKEHCVLIMQNEPGASRATLMNLFMSQVGLTKAGASTYYYNLKKEMA